jgi:hypothetical protein
MDPDNRKTDKNTIHSYVPEYEKLFERLKTKATNVLEIGICGGGSIKLWSDYFPNATVHGLDVEDLAPFLDDFPRVKKYITNAYDFGILTELKKTKFDIVIDDGPHSLDSMAFFAKYYSELLTDDGILVIEDIQDIRWCTELINFLPQELRTKVRIIDLRHVKGRYDDIMFVVDKGIA